MRSGPIILAALAFAMVATGAQAKSDAYANIHSVAVVSTLGDGLLMIQDIELAAKPDADFVLPLGLDLDRTIEGKIKEAVAGRFAVIESSLDGASLGSYDDRAADRQAVRAMISRLPGPQPDALILVQSHTITQQSMIRALTFQYTGLSLTRTKGLFGRYSLLLSAQYAVSVIDAKTGERIGFGSALLPPTGLLGLRPDPILTCDEAIWPKLPHAPSEDEKAQIQAEAMAVIAMSLPNALEVAGLSPAGSSTKLTDWNGRKLICHEFG
jgi:hypothetical protein